MWGFFYATKHQLYINPLDPIGYFVYHQCLHSEILHSTHGVCALLWFSGQITIIFLYSVNLAGLYNKDEVCLLRSTYLIFKYDWD